MWVNVLVSSGVVESWWILLYLMVFLCSGMVLVMIILLSVEFVMWVVVLFDSIGCV